MKKLQQLGKSLSRTEQKGIAGAGIQRYLWSCLIPDFGYSNVCYSVQPQGPCSYSEPCTSLGVLCFESQDYCVYV
ncbi:MAG: hypothetical protein QM731_25415 [Chitinophagaceae bacterium]